MVPSISTLSFQINPIANSKRNGESFISTSKRLKSTLPRRSNSSFSSATVNSWIGLDLDGWIGLARGINSEMAGGLGIHTYSAICRASSTGGYNVG